MKSCKELLIEYRSKNGKHYPEKLIFENVGKKDVYNITAPFETESGLIIAGRVESRDSEHSEVQFFKETENGKWRPLENAPVFQLQDPFVTKIDHQIILGGVKIFPKENQPHLLDWKTCFYKGSNLSNLKLFFEGPIGMKDVRLKQLANKKILLLTRPQGEIGGKGKIGATILENLNDLSIKRIDKAKILEDLFLESEWGGANEVHQLDGKVAGILGHIANFDSEGNRHYYSMIFKLDTETLEYSALKIIAERKDFVEGASKRPDLKDVVFSGGLIRNGKKTELYVGTSDAEAQRIKMEDPFK